MISRLEMLKTGSSKLYPLLETLSQYIYVLQFCPDWYFNSAKKTYTSKWSWLSGVDSQVLRFASLSLRLPLRVFLWSVTDVFSSLKWLPAEINPICLNLILLERKRSHTREFHCGALCPLCPRLKKKQSLMTVFSHCLSCSQRTFYQQSIIQYKYHMQPSSSYIIN